MQQPTTTGMSKSTLRSFMRTRLRSVPIEDRTSKSTSIAAHVIGLPQWQTAQVVSVFLSMSHEVDTSPLVRTAFESDKKVFVPCIVNSESKTTDLKEPVVSKEMVMVPLYSFTDYQTLPRDKWGIPTPPDPDQRQPWASANNSFAPSIDMILIPGLAFDRHGHRLGYGRGYYDNWLAHHAGEQALRVALAFDSQIFPQPDIDVLQIPTEPHDELVSLIVTESGGIPCCN